MSDNLAKAIELVFGSEGGFVNHPRDPGGPTKYGVTAATLGAWRKLGRRAAPAEVMALALAEATRILDKQYAQPLRYAELPAGLDYALFDFAVNSGPAQAIRTLQRILGVEPDGIMGVKTAAAIDATAAAGLVERLCDARLAFLRRLTTWPTFGKGWRARVEHVRATAQRMAGGRRGAGPAPETGRETADPADTRIAATPAGKGTIAATIGAAGAALGAARDSLQPLTGSGGFVDTLFGLLVVGGSLAAVAGLAVVAYQQAKYRAVSA